MNLNFPETPNHRNAPWSDWQDGEPFYEPTPAECARSLIVEGIEAFRADVAFAFERGGITEAERDRIISRLEGML